MGGSKVPPMPPILRCFLEFRLLAGCIFPRILSNYLTGVSKLYLGNDISHDQTPLSENQGDL